MHVDLDLSRHRYPKMELNELVKAIVASYMPVVPTFAEVCSEIENELPLETNIPGAVSNCAFQLEGNAGLALAIRNKIKVILYHQYPELNTMSYTPDSLGVIIHARMCLNNLAFHISQNEVNYSTPFYKDYLFDFSDYLVYQPGLENWKRKEFEKITLDYLLEKKWIQRFKRDELMLVAN